MPYGFVDIRSIEHETGQDTGRSREAQWPLLPAMLPTTREFQTQESINAEDAQGLRNRAELMFMHAFLVNQYRPDHTVSRLEANYLDEQLSGMGIGSSIIQQAIEDFNNDLHFGSELRQNSLDGASNPSFVDGATEGQRLGDLIQNLDGGETTADEQSNFDWRAGNEDSDADREGQNTLNLLYHIAADQARRDGYIHRGVECNACRVMPIQGIRYRCANCQDYDLCESCEAQEPHTKTHVFYKFRLPAPSIGVMGNSRQALPLWYPGKPGAMPRSLPRGLSSRLLHETGFDSSELDALWDQFRCSAGSVWNKDPNKLGMAIDRKIFDKCFVPPLSIRSPPPSLIYDRMFAFYDTNNDGWIGFEEFLKGLARLSDNSREGRLRRIFQGYDIDNDGYVDRKDFLRIFRAYYTLHKELNREVVAGLEEDLIDGGARDIVHGSQPISSAFPGSIPRGHMSQGGVGKAVDANGDLAIVDNRGILNEDPYDIGDRNHVIADIAMRYPRAEPRSSRRAQTDSPLPEPRQFGIDEPSTHPAENDNSFRIEQRRINAVHERWRRRRFYTDVEEGSTIPPGYTEVDSSDSEAGNGQDAIGSVNSASASRPLSPRSRSSSKVRFEDSVTDTDHETRSNTSSRSVPVGERWGGYDISEIEKDAGKEILYQAVQQGFNELLDQLFKEKEDLAMEAHKTRKLRRNYAKEMRAFAESLEPEPKPQATGHESDQSEERAKTTQSDADSQNEDSKLNVLLHEVGYSPEHTVSEPEQDQSQNNPPPPPPDHPIYTGLVQAYGFNMQHYLAPIPPPALEQDQQDPTMPQFCPNEEGTNAPPPPSDDADAGKLPNPRSRPAASIHEPEPGSSAPPPDPDLSDLSSPTSRAILSTYLRHEQVDDEAKARGGFGRLNYAEFVRGMVGSDDSSNRPDGAGKDADGKDKQNWGEGGRLGRLGFIGSWLEMSSF